MPLHFEYYDPDYVDMMTARERYSENYLDEEECEEDADSRGLQDVQRQRIDYADE